MKKSRLYAFILCAAMLMALLPTLLPTAVLAAPIVEYVDYDITTNTTWSAGEYYICKTGNRGPRIVDGAQLTIESGAKVYFSTRTNVELPESGGKNPYSGLTVTNGTLSATGVTFTTVPDVPEQTTWRDAGWNGIQAIGAGEAGTTSLFFANCTFENSGFNDAGTLYGVQSNGINSEVNISVSSCTFSNPKVGATAIRYNNGSNTVGSGTISVTNSNFTGYGRGVQVEQNGDDAVNTTVSVCIFSNISIRPLEINGGRQAVVTGNSFNNFVTGQHDNPVLIYDSYAPTGTDQTVTLTGNTFNYGSSANIYPVVIGAGCKINEAITSPTITFDTDYPAAYRYIVLSKGVGYLNNHRNAVWSNAGIPYLLASEITITGTDETNQSSLTIKPGVTVCLGDGSGSDNLTVRGTLTAEGTSAQPITFTKKTGTTYGNEIYASNNLKGSIDLKHCVMDGLYRGIGILSSSTTAGLISLENCTVQNSQHSMLLKGYNVSVKNCVLIGKGVETGGGNYVNSTIIEGCSITASGASSDNGIDLNTAKGVVLKNCLISGFSGYGVAVNSNGYATLAEGAPLIENCTIAGNGYGVVFSRDFSLAYGAFIRNTIIADNTGLDLASKAYTSGTSNYSVTIADGSMGYSLIGDDGVSLTFDQLGYCEHPTLGKIRRMAAATYSNRVTGDPMFANAANGDYHLKSTVGRWNGSTWVADAVTSPCIDAGDSASAYANEPAPNGGRINLGCYGNTAQASKSSGSNESYTISVIASPLVGGAVSGGGNFTEGSSATVTALANAGYHFVRWTENGVQVSVSANYTFSATANRTLIAVFERDMPINPPTPPTPPIPVPITSPPATKVGSGDSINTTDINQLISDSKPLTVEDKNGAKLVFDTDALKGIVSQTIGSIKAEIEDVSAAYKDEDEYAGKLVFSLKVSSGDKTITDFGGSVLVSLPFEQKEGASHDKVAVWYLTESGDMFEIPCTYDPKTKLVSFEVSHFSLYVVGVAKAWENPFTDVKETDWFYDAVQFVNKNNLMLGSGDEIFNPQAYTSRGMILTILWRLEGEPTAAKPMTFTDVAEGKWYYKAVAWAADKGLVNGYSADRFGPEDYISREQMAKIFYTYATYKSYDISARNNLSKFADSPSSWALESAQWAVAEGLIQGKGGNRLEPQGKAKRCECAAILKRFIEKH